MRPRRQCGLAIGFVAGDQPAGGELELIENWRTLLTCANAIGECADAQLVSVAR
jgi:hypothetical protein